MVRTKKWKEILGVSGKNPKNPKGKVRKPRRRRPGTVSIREIRKYQTSTNLLIPKLGFERLIKELLEVECRQLHLGHCKKIQRSATLALQCAAEHYLTELFQQSQMAAIHGKRQTVQPEDLQIVRYFRDDELRFNKTDNL